MHEEILFLSQRGGQKISKFALVLVGLAWLFIIVMLFVVVLGDNLVTWLQYLYYFSYIKLGVTIIKYIPQVSKCELLWHVLMKFGVNIINFIPQVCNVTAN